MNAEGVLTPCSAEVVVTSVCVSKLRTQTNLFPATGWCLFSLTSFPTGQGLRMPPHHFHFPVCTDDACSAFSSYISTSKSSNTPWLRLKVWVSCNATSHFWHACQAWCTSPHASWGSSATWEPWVCSRACCSTIGSWSGQQHCQDTTGAGVCARSLVCATALSDSSTP